MHRQYYSAKIKEFLYTDNDNILGQLLINDEFETTELQKNAWKIQIEVLKQQLAPFSHGNIVFEYTIPRIGRRIDTVCIVNGLIFLLEFKVGESGYKKSTDDQVMDYALDLKYFHEASRDCYIIPIAVSTEAPNEENHVFFMDDGIASVLHCNKNINTL